MTGATWAETRIESATTPQVRQLAWFVAGAVLGFGVPFVFSSVLDLHHDQYYAIYFASVLTFLAVYVRATRLDVAEFFRRNWKWSAGLGVVAAIIVVAGTLAREDSTPRPDGMYLVFSVGWRGVVYGAVDALLLSAFPVAVAFAFFGGRLGSVMRTAGFASLAIVLVVVITATYHLGYEQFREDGVGAPEIGNTIISVPAIATINPLGAVIAHASMHVTADIHAYETSTYLPPQIDAD